MAQEITFKKNISTFSLMMTGITSIIGSGWLLSTQKLSNIAGPAALFSWVIGMLIAMSVALCFIEVGSSIRNAGGIGYYSKLTHGEFSGFLTSWINFLSIVIVPAIEAQAIIQYLSQLSPYFMTWYNPIIHEMTGLGIFYAFILMLFFMYINYWSVQLFIKFNNLLTLIKFLVPLITIICLFYNGIDYGNFGSTLNEFNPFGFRAIFASVVSCGVVMSFNGFQTPMTFANEIQSPEKQLPIAVLGSIFITFILYLLLQFVFIGALDSKLVLSGWQNIHFRSPYINLLLLANMQVMVWVIYVSSVLAPAACGSAFLASSSRMLYALSNDKLLPQFLSFLNPKYHSPRNAVIACTVVGCIALLLFRSWSSLVGVISILHLFSYLSAPVMVIASRLKKLSTTNKKFSLPLAHILAPIIFIALSFLLFFSAWPLVPEMMALIIPGLMFYYYYQLKVYSIQKMLKLFFHASWIIIYFTGLNIICYFGNNLNMQTNIWSIETSSVVLTIFSYLVFIYGAYFSYEK